MFQVTIHHAFESNSICAVFKKSTDAKLFIESCKNNNAINHVKSKYSLVELKNISSAGNCGIDHPFVITTDNAINSATTVAFIRSMSEVYLFLGAKFADHDNDAKTYYIFDRDNLISKHDQDPNVANQSKEQKLFRPTPLPMKLRLGPGGYWVDPDDKDKK